MKRFNFNTLAEVQAANEKYGRFFFSEATMNFFNSRLETDLLVGGYFVTSEQFDDESPRLFTIRRVKNVSGHIETIGSFQEYKTKDEAKKALHRLTSALKEYSKVTKRKRVLEKEFDF